MGKNKIMKNSDMEHQKINNCTIHTMPPKITDEDITALFNGVLNIVRKKVELDSQNEIFHLGTSITRLKKDLKEKTAECNRLKNQIIFLKSKLKEK